MIKTLKSILSAGIISGASALSLMGGTNDLRVSGMNIVTSNGVQYADITAAGTFPNERFRIQSSNTLSTNSADWAYYGVNADGKYMEGSNLTTRIPLSTGKFFKIMQDERIAISSITPVTTARGRGVRLVADNLSPTNSYNFFFSNVLSTNDVDWTRDYEVITSAKPTKTFLESSLKGYSPCFFKLERTK